MGLKEAFRERVSRSVEQGNQGNRIAAFQILVWAAERECSAAMSSPQSRQGRRKHHHAIHQLLVCKNLASKIGLSDRRINRALGYGYGRAIRRLLFS